MLLKARDTFFGDPDGLNNNHLWIVLHIYVPPNATEPWVIVVNVTSWKSHGSDPACELRVGDHPFITHDSFVIYRRALHRPLATFAGFDQRKRAVVSPELYQRVLAGFHASRFARQALKAKLPRP